MSQIPSPPGPRRSPLPARGLGVEERTRTRVSQSLLGVPPLLLIHALLGLRWHLGLLDGVALAWFVGVTLAGCGLFVALLGSGWSEALSAEPSLSAPQMGYAMACVGWGYALAGPARALLLCLMPVILCFGLFALRPPAARALAVFALLAMGAEMLALAATAPATHPPLDEATHFAFLFMSVVMVQVLSLRLGRIRARLSAQKAELAEALHRLSLLASRDALTGLLNRRAAQEELRTAASQAGLHGRPLVLALVDLDHFKQVNDRFGHQAGDRVLQLFARVAQQALRGADRVARWGGEEFLFVLPATTEEEACVALQRLREAYAAASDDSLPVAVPRSFSAGVAHCAGPPDIDAAIDRADRALYQAKQAGRARTQTARPVTP